jgi:hypothetical protein
MRRGACGPATRTALGRCSPGPFAACGGLRRWLAARWLATVYAMPQISWSENRMCRRPGLTRRSLAISRHRSSEARFTQITGRRAARTSLDDAVGRARAMDRAKAPTLTCAASAACRPAAVASVPRGERQPLRWQVGLGCSAAERTIASTAGRAAVTAPMRASCPPFHGHVAAAEIPVSGMSGRVVSRRRHPGRATTHQPRAACVMSRQRLRLERHDSPRSTAGCHRSCEVLA